MNPAEPAKDHASAATAKPPPALLFQREADLIARRRHAAGYGEKAKGRPFVGVALSGGGIRSATFCLGLFQTLARHGLVRNVDYLSTVSGGGYFGSFLGRMFTRQWVTEDPLPPPPIDPPLATSDPREHRKLNHERFLANLQVPNPPAPPPSVHHQAAPPPPPSRPVGRVEAALADSHSPPLIWLRESGNYLAPGGFSDAALDISTYLRNWLSMLIVMLTTACALFVGLNWLRYGLLQQHCCPGLAAQCVTLELQLAGGAGPHLWWTPTLLLPVLLFLFVLVPLGMAYWFTQILRDVWAAWLAGLIVIAAAAVPAWNPVRFPPWLPPGHLGSCYFALVFIVVLAMAAYLVFRLLALANCIVESRLWIRNLMAKCLSAVLQLTVAAFLVAMVDGWGQTIYAVVRFAGSWHDAMPALTGVLGLTVLAPMVRALVLSGPGAGGKFKVPLQYAALIFSLVVVLILLVGLAFCSHALAWDGRLPLIPKPTPAINALSPTAVTHATPNAVGSQTDTNINPGALIFHQWVTHTNDVRLTAEHLVQVVPADAPLDTAPSKNGADLKLLGWGFFLSTALSWLFGRTIGFLNLSSYHTLYSSRLIRAYQGASDQKRWETTANVTFAKSDDDIAWCDYRPHEHGGPLHLINSTINCTESLETAMESTTAKGLNLCIGPAGISYGPRLAVFAADTNLAKVIPLLDGHLDGQPIHIESLPLGDWVGISGAAFTTGMGNVGGETGTTLGTSLVCGLFNVRLGYWWDNDISPSHLCSYKKAFPVQTYLADEFLASFHIINRDHWYLSDGGHFENTAAYELIRRRVPFIILADCGADPDSAFEDLANLTRRVRIDFAAELTFLDAAAVAGIVGAASPWIGSLADLRAEKTFVGRAGSSLPAGNPDPLVVPRMAKYAALAQVIYHGEPADPQPKTTLILIIKPGLTVTGQEPEDLVNYQLANDTFPHQNTAEQFYDEAQWESYRKLGEYAMKRVLEGGWLEKKLKP